MSRERRPPTRRARTKGELTEALPLDIELLRTAVAALPEMRRAGVRRLSVGGLTLELEHAEPGYEPDGPVQAGDRGDEHDVGLPGQPAPGESDNLDLAAVDG